MPLDEETIKQIYFYCDNKDPNGMYHNNDDNLDVLEFAKKIAEYVDINARKEEHLRCVEIAKAVNSKVAELINTKAP